jgi:glycosyltransferase involved in cell wall biosynthesis
LKDILISVITVTYNDRIGLKKTLQSTQNQTYEWIEHIVIDGGSTDGTLKLIAKYE